MAGRQVRRSQPIYGRKPDPIRGRVKERRGGRLKLAMILIGLIVVGIGVEFRVRRVEVSGNAAVSTAELAASVKHSQRRHLLARNLVTINQGQIEKEILGENYRLKTVMISRHWPNGLAVSVTERQPSLGWRSGEVSYLVDTEGTIIGPITGQSSLPVVVDTTNLPVKPGDRVAPTRFIDFTSELVRDFESTTGLKLTGLSVQQTTSELEAQTNQPYVIKFDTTRGVKAQLGELVAVLAELKASGKQPAERIDVRIERKAYYK